jgi:hypothetical protein
MAKKELVENIVKLYSKLGGNMNDVLGSRSNITFLGTGKNPEPFTEMSINIEAVGALGKSKVLDELKSPMGYLTADKLNDIQASKLYENLLKLDEFYNPRSAPANITDMATGTRDLDPKGLAALRSRVDDLPPGDPDLPPPGSRGGPDDIAAPFASAEETISNLRKQDPELAAQFQKMMTNKGNTPSKRSAAREFLVEALKKDETDIGTAAFGKVNLNNVISAEDVKFITEGGGGLAGDPIVLVEKYFGPRIAELLPAGATGDEIIRFTNRVLTSVEDAAGLKPDNPKFDKFTARFIDEMAAGGRAGFRFGKAAGKAFGLSKKLANINKSVDEGTPMGYGALREYGIEAEDITNLFKNIAMDKTMVGAEKTEYFKQLNKVLKNPDDYPEFIKEIKIKLGIGLADGGRAGYKLGKSVFKGIADLYKRGKQKTFDFIDEQARIPRPSESFKSQGITQDLIEGPITLDKMKNVDPESLRIITNTYEQGLYSEMPEIIKAGNLLERFTKFIPGKLIGEPGKRVIDYERASAILGVELKGTETLDEIFAIERATRKAEGGLAKILEV